MGFVLGLGPRCRLYGVLASSVSRWSAAEPSVEVVLLAQLAPDISGNDFAGVRCRRGSGYWRHLQPTRSRGSAKLRGATSDALVYSHAHLSSVPAYAIAPRRGSRASADQVVCLRCCGGG